MRDYEGEKEDYPGQPGWSNAIRIFKDTDGSPYPTWVRVIEKIAQVAEMGDSKRGHLGMVPEIVKRGAVPKSCKRKFLPFTPAIKPFWRKLILPIGRKARPFMKRVN